MHIFLGGAAVARSPVKGKVVGSNPTRGASWHLIYQRKGVKNMGVEQQDVIKPVHVTKAEAAVAVASGLALGIGIVANPYFAIGGGLIGLGTGLRVCGREAEEKSRQRSESKKQGKITDK